MLVAEDGLFRDGLRSILAAARDAEVALSNGDRSAALRAAGSARPHVILVDLAAVPGADGAFLTALVQNAEGARLLLLTESNVGDDGPRAVQGAGVGVLSKRKSAKSLLEMVDGLRATPPEIEPSALERVVSLILRGSRSRDLPNPFARLTRRENEIADLVSHGLNNRELADRLGISEATVRHHLTSIFAKLEVRDRVGLVIASLGRARASASDG